MDITAQELMKRRDELREIKGLDSELIISGKREFLKEINLLLLTAYRKREPNDLKNMVIAMKNFLDKFDLAEDCYIITDPESYITRFLLAEDVADV